MFKKYQVGFNKKSNPSKKGRGNFRVRGPIKSFRDLDVYNKSTELSADIFLLSVPQEAGLEEELKLLKNISKQIPKMIAESYGNRFDDFAVAERKLEKTAELVTAVISKMDFFLSVVKKVKSSDDDALKAEKEGEAEGEDKVTAIDEFEKELHRLLREYSTNRVKILNLKKSWVRNNEKFRKK